MKRNAFVVSFGFAFCILLALDRAPLNASSAAGEQDGRLTAATIFDWKTVGDPQVSPDGKRIAYVYSWVDIMEDTNWSNLWMATVDGRDLRPLTHGSHRDRSPRWSPDGSKLAYLSDRRGKTNIWIRWMDTGQEAQVTDLLEAPSNIAWSPDGRLIAFNKLVPDAPPAGIQMPPRPRGAKWAEPPIVVDRLIYRHDGLGYLPHGFTHIFTVPVAGGGPRQITKGDCDHGEPEWSPDGHTIFFSGVCKPEAEWVQNDTEVYAVAAADGSIRALTKRVGPDDHPLPSPDGKWLAYTGFDEELNGYTNRQLYVMRPDGTSSRLLSGSWDRGVSEPQWAADSSGVYVTSDDRGSTHLHFFPIEGSRRQLTRGQLQITAFSVAGNGQAAAIVTKPEEPHDIFSFHVTQPELCRVTNVNGSLLGDIQLADVEEIWYKSFDGRDIQGWIMKPPDFDASEKYPLLLYIHGGPYAMYGVGFRHEFQVHAANGYVVLYTNPRGSTGYGQEFARTIYDDYPGDNFFDLMRGVDAVIARGYINDRQLAVTGGSGGGLLTTWVIGHTDRFAVAAAQYPTINWYSMVPTTDRNYHLGRGRFRKWPWEDPERYLKHSSIRYVANVKTPVLLITGEADLRTPMSQTEEYYGSLKILKKETKMVRVPDEPHGIRVHPSHRVAKILFLIDWFDSHLRRNP